MKRNQPLNDSRQPRPGLSKAALTLCCFLGGGLAACGHAGDTEPWGGTLRSGVLAMSEEAAGGRVEAALSIADQMLAPGGAAQLRERLNGATRGVSESVLSPITSVLDLVGVSALQPSDRAEIEYARAAALLAGAAKGEENAPGLLERAEKALGRARGAAPGDVRRSAVYNQGTLDLMGAEAVRGTIPEIAGTGGAGPTAPPNPSPQGAEEAPDPLDVARALYLQARAHFVEYLTEGEGEDAAANVELAIRRLRELDEIAKQREQQKQDQEPSEDGEESEEGEQEPSDDEQENKDDQKSDQEPSEDEQDSEEQGEDDPSEGDSEEDSEDKSKEEPEEPEEEGEPEGEEEEGEQEGEPKPGEEEIEEITMTAEEFQRLLEQNKKHQERGEEIRRMRRMSRKIPAKKDW